MDGYGSNSNVSGGSATGTGAGSTGIGMPTLPVPAQVTVQNNNATTFGGIVSGAAPATKPKVGTHDNIIGFFGKTVQRPPKTHVDWDSEDETQPARRNAKRPRTTAGAGAAGTATATTAPKTRGRKAKASPAAPSANAPAAPSVAAQPTPPTNAPDGLQIVAPCGWQAAAQHRQRVQGLGQGLRQEQKAPLGLGLGQQGTRQLGSRQAGLRRLEHAHGNQLPWAQQPLAVAPYTLANQDAFQGQQGPPAAYGQADQLASSSGVISNNRVINNMVLLGAPVVNATVFLPGSFNAGPLNAGGIGLNLMALENNGSGLDAQATADMVEGTAAVSIPQGHDFDFSGQQAFLPSASLPNQDPFPSTPSQTVNPRDVFGGPSTDFVPLCDNILDNCESPLAPALAPDSGTSFASGESESLEFDSAFLAAGQLLASAPQVAPPANQPVLSPDEQDYIHLLPVVEFNRTH